MKSKKRLGRLLTVLLTLALIMSSCFVFPAQLTAGAEAIGVTYDYDDSATLGDGGTLTVIGGAVTLPTNSEILNLKWRNGDRLYNPGETVNVSGLVADGSGNVKFTAFYTGVSIDFSNFEAGHGFYNSGDIDGFWQYTTELNGDNMQTKLTAVEEYSQYTNQGVNLVLFDIVNGQKKYVYFNRNQQYTISYDYMQSGVTNESAKTYVGFGLSDKTDWRASLGKSNGNYSKELVVAKSDEWITRTVTLTTPNTYRWAPSQDNQPNATEKLSRRMAIGAEGVKVGGFVYFDNITIKPINTGLAALDSAVFDYDDSATLGDTEVVELGETVTLPNRDDILNLESWKNGNHYYTPGETVNKSALELDAMGNANFMAVYGSATIDYSNYPDGFRYYYDKPIEGHWSYKTTTEDGDACVGPNPTDSEYQLERDSNFVLFDFVGGKRAYVHFNRGQKYEVTYSYKLSGTIYDGANAFVAFGMTNDWHVSQGQYSGSGSANGSKRFLSSNYQTGTWVTNTLTVTAPTSYAWKNGDVAQTTGLTRHVALGVAGIRKDGYVYIDDITISPVQNEYTLDYCCEDMANVNVSFKRGDVITEFETPVREGYLFAGWYTDNAFANKVGESWSPNQGDTLYAAWLPVSTKGDINNDNAFNIKDLVAMKKAAANIGAVATKLRADLDNDNYVQTSDLVLLRKLLFGLDEIPIGTKISGVNIRHYKVVVADALSIADEAVDELLETFGIGKQAQGKESSFEIFIGECGRAPSTSKVLQVKGTKLVINSSSPVNIVNAINTIVNYQKIAAAMNVTLDLKDGYALDPKGSLSSDYRMVFRDEFNGNSLDRNVWGNMENYYLTSESVTTNSGNAVLTAKRNSDGSYSSVTMCTQDSMKYLYGYIEVRAKMGVHPGSSSLWFSADKSPITQNGAEIDFFETINRSIPDNTTEFYSNIHSWERGVEVQQSLDLYPDVKNDATYITNPSVSLSNDYHIYGMKWTSEEYVFYVDGVEYFRYDINNGILSKNGENADTFRQPMFILLSNYMDDIGDYSPAWQQGDPDHSDFYVDYVRLYQRDCDNGQLITTP